MSDTQAAPASTPKAAPNAPFFDPTADFTAKTPIPVEAGTASAIPVLAVYRENVRGKTAVEIYFALVGKNGCLFDPETRMPTQCAVVRSTFWLTGTQNDKGAQDAFKAALHAMSYLEPIKSLTREVMDAWCAKMTASWRFVTLVLEKDPKNDRYVRVRHVNPLAASKVSPDFRKALKDTGVVADAANRAGETALKVAKSTGGDTAEQLEVADDIPF